MRVKTICQLGAFGIVLLLLASMLSAKAAANTVPAAGLAERQVAVTANLLKPSECAGLDLSAVIVGGGVFTGTAASELILGSSGVDTINGGGGDDCIVGGGGIDALLGNGGTDVCIGGPGADVLDLSCEARYQ